MSDTGWIKLHRQLQDSPLWHSEPFSKAQAWIDLIMSMNHKDEKVLFDNQLIEVKRGQHITSYRKLSVNWKWSIGKVKRFFELLANDNMVKVEHFKNGTLLTLVNYELYQGERNTDGTPIDAPMNTPIDTQTEQTRNTDGTLTETNKNDKNDKNDKEVKNNIPPISPTGDGESKKRFVPPTVDQVRAYCLERNNGIDAEAFIAHYESNGWCVGKSKMKNWKKAITTWEINRGFHYKPPDKPKQVMENPDEEELVGDDW